MLQIPARFHAFKIISESGIAAGVRRIEALTSDALYAYYDKLEEIINEAAALLKTNAAGLTEKITHLQAEVKELHSENEVLKEQSCAGCTWRCYGSRRGSKRRKTSGNSSGER